MPQRRGDGFSATFGRKVSVGKISSDQRVELGYSFKILKQRVLIVGCFNEDSGDDPTATVASK